ncbi:hypothetical protein CA267_017335 [Alteromonas pelagimontana]|uniref:Orphan protein n=1 Tax=Alteromonas pelagimontana TaxID=1858656 RepID=A0A6M4MHJ4_9ALTE|nr:hypothetical protein [Alteromonas pelagimontana]QJR82388.1 hypothetical protein CA267_017335 [Alteromonas pelagimontana]
MNSAFNNRYIRLLRMSNIAMAITLMLLVSTVLICYPFSEYFSVPTQIASHILMIVIAAALKISYVSRCVALHELRMEVR